MAGGVPEGYDAFVPAKRPILMVKPIPDSTQGPSGGSSAAQTVYDFKFDRATCKWIPWVDTIAPMAFPAGATFSELIVPTKDTARCASVCLSLAVGALGFKTAHEHTPLLHLNGKGSRRRVSVVTTVVYCSLAQVHVPAGPGPAAQPAPAAGWRERDRQDLHYCGPHLERRPASGAVDPCLCDAVLQDQRKHAAGAGAHSCHLCQAKPHRQRATWCFCVQNAR
jgi:hypothetical protein